MQPKHHLSEKHQETDITSKLSKSHTVYSVVMFMHHTFVHPLPLSTMTDVSKYKSSGNMNNSIN